MIHSSNLVSVSGSHHGPAMESKRARSDSITSAGSNGSAQRRVGTLDHHSMNAHRRPLEEFLTALRKGAELLKHGRRGSPKIHFFWLADNDTRLTWRSARGNQRGVLLSFVTQIVHGQTTEIFKRHLLPSHARLSFSLLYKEDDDEIRTLDLTCKNEQEFTLWYWGIQAVMEQICRGSTTNTPITSPVQALTASPQNQYQRVSGHGPFSATADSSSHNPTRSLTASGIGAVDPPSHISGPLLPVPERVPGDCYVWGSSEAPSTKKASAGRASGWLHSTTPTLVDNTTHLDVCEVAVSLRHAALLTHKGEMYTWGHGAGGKLGQGNNEDADSPLRVYTLWGKNVKHIACGDGCTAAITNDDRLYTWGDGASANLGYANTLRQFIPRQVEKGLGDLKITQVSCGPFHTCAISSAGHLFSWGDGLCGKLGHGDTTTCSEPRQVMALANQAVLHVACGFWHTACVARTQQQGQDAAGAVNYLGGSVDSSASFEESSIGIMRATSSLVRKPNPASSGTQMQEHARQIGAGPMGAVRGDLYTWGGEFTWVDQKKDKAGHVTAKRDSHKGCLGLGSNEGSLVPVRVYGPWLEGAVQQVETGLNLTVVLTAEGQCFQMGETGASGKVKWEGCKEPELVAGPLMGYVVERISVGIQHVAALASPADRRTGLPQAGSEFSAMFMWGRGREGQLGVGSCQDNSIPKIVEELKGRKILKVACGGNHTLAVCAHDTVQQEKEEKKKGYTQRVMSMFTAKPVTVEVPDSRTHSSGPTTAGSGGITPLDRISDGSMSLMNHGSNDLSVTPRKAAGDEHITSSVNRSSRNNPKSTSTGSLMGAVRAAAASRKNKKDDRRSGDDRNGAPGIRVSGRRYADGRVGRFRLQGANSTESLAGRDGGKAISEVGVWGPERSKPSVAESDGGSAFSAPEVYGEESFVIDDLVAEAEARERHWQAQVQGLQGKVEKLESLLQREMGHYSPTPRPVYDVSPTAAGPVRQQSRYPLSPDERQAAASPSGRDAPSEPRLPSEKRGSIMSRTQDLRNSEGRRPSMGMTYAEMGERRDSINKEALAAAELYGAFDRTSELRGSPGSTRRGSSCSDPERQELDRERRELRQMRAELERRVGEFDKKQTKLLGTRRGSTTKLSDAGYESPLKAERPTSSELDRSLMQMGSRSGSGGSMSRQGPGSVDLPISKAKGHRKTASLGQGTPSTGDLGPEWTEEVDQGVFLTFARQGNGQNSLTRIRFNRQHFDKTAASLWWQNNKMAMGLRYNIASNSETPTGLHTPESESGLGDAHASPSGHRRSLSATQLAHLQDLISPQPITRLHGSGTIFAGASPRAGHPHPALALSSPTNALASPIDQAFASRADSASADSFATPSSSLLTSPITSPSRTGSFASDAAINGGWAQRPGNRLSTSPSNAGAIKWGRLGAADHMFSLPITPTAHLNQRGFVHPGHSSRLSHVSRADSYAARHTFQETQSSLSRNSSVAPLPPSSSRTSGRHSTPASPPSGKAVLRGSTSKAASLAATGGALATFKVTEPAGYLPEATWRDSSSRRNVSLDVDAHSPASNAFLAAPSREDSFSSSSSQDSESASSVIQHLSAQSAEGTRGTARVLAWHPPDEVTQSGDSYTSVDKSQRSMSSRRSMAGRTLKIPESPGFGDSNSPRIDAWSPRTSSAGLPSPGRFSPSSGGVGHLAKASPKARSSDLGLGATSRSRFSKAPASGYATQRRRSEAQG